MGLLDGDAGISEALRLVRDGRLAEAEAALASLAAGPRAAAALLAGAVAYRRGDLERALSETGRAVQLALDDGEALTALAAIQLALGRPAFARQPAERAARLAADVAGGHAALAAAEQRQDRTDAAHAALSRAAVAAALAAGLTADSPRFRTIAAGLAARLVTAGQEERAGRFRAAAQGAAAES
jgi:Flp pilus assembly protein TadD